MSDVTRNRPTVSLVLSSGGARGLAHIGAIQCLEARGYEIRYVSGSSMGALVGGVYAAGRLNEYAEWVAALKRSDIMQLLDFGWGASAGLFKGERIISVMKELVGEWDIDDLSIGFTAVATELNRKREVWISHGALFDAIRASMAIPLVFAPVTRGDQILVDGAVLNPLPIAPTLSQHNDLIVAVDVNGLDDRAFERLRRDEAQNSPQVSGAPPEDDDTDDQGLRASVTRFLDDFFSSEEPDKIDRGMFDIATESMDTMQVAISRLKLSVHSPDLLLQMPRNVARFFEFERGRELIDLGYERMDALLDTGA